MHPRLLPLLAPLCALPALVLTTPAWAATAPPNDNRANAQQVNVPGSVDGTTVGSTVESGEPNNFCTTTGGSVWYRFTATAARGVLVSLEANGNLDAEVAVFQLRRSRLDGVACGVTDDNGHAAAGFTPAPKGTYLVRVAELPASEQNSFRLTFVLGSPPAEPPGHALPLRGARGSLDSVLHVDVAYGVNLKAGRPSLLNLVYNNNNGFCMALDLFPPGTRAFENSSPVVSLGCGGYAVYTAPPGTGGRYVARVTASPDISGPQPYTLLAGPAGRDDIAPGLLLKNFARRTGSVNGGSLDAVDLYRFDVGKRSALDLTLRGQRGRNLDLELRDDRGKQLACGCNGGALQKVSRRIGRGHYYVAVRSRDLVPATYVLSRRSRTITSTAITVNRRKSTTVRPGQPVVIGVRVTEVQSAAATVAIEHFDPFQGWLPFAEHKVTLRRGSGRVRWVPPSVGRWRTRAEFAGARLLAPSQSRWAGVSVAAPFTPGSAAARNAIALRVR